MPRIAGIDVPDKKKVYYALQYIHGVGEKFAAEILAKAGVDPNTPPSRWTRKHSPASTPSSTPITSSKRALRRQVQQNIQRLKDIKSYRGDRHRKGLPVRGQRTQSNARTRKGRKKTVAGKKGVKAK